MRIPYITSKKSHQTLALRLAFYSTVSVFRYISSFLINQSYPVQVWSESRIRL